jgi:hypothetical protein
MKNFELTKKELVLLKLVLLSVADYNQMDEVKRCKLTMVSNDELKELKEKFGFPTK